MNLTLEQRERLARTIDMAVEHFALVEFGVEAVDSTVHVDEHAMAGDYRIGAHDELRVTVT